GCSDRARPTFLLTEHSRGWAVGAFGAALTPGSVHASVALETKPARAMLKRGMLQRGSSDAAGRADHAAGDRSDRSWTRRPGRTRHRPVARTLVDGRQAAAQGPHGIAHRYPPVEYVRRCRGTLGPGRPRGQLPTRRPGGDRR